jgi:membrane-bound lytic murein transglycosylase F
MYPMLKPPFAYRWAYRLCAAALTIALVALSQGCTRQDSLDHILSTGELRVVSRNGPTTFYKDKNGPTGFEYHLAKKLAEDLGVSLQLEPAFTIESIFTRLNREEADLAAAGLTLTGQRQDNYPYSSSYYSSIPQIIYKAGTFRPRSLADLSDMDIVVMADSSHAHALLALSSGGSSLSWKEIEGADSMELLELVNTGEAKLAILDSNEFKVQQPLYPRLKVAFDMGGEQEFVWFLSPGRNNKRLLARISELFKHLDESGEMERLTKLYLAPDAGITRIGAHTFTRNMRRVLPQYQALIQQVAVEYQLDWHLLGAIAYQESHWNPSATSPTGVRGMMMLTRPTARVLGVKDRLDPLQSLRGGARYLKNIKRRLPQRIKEPDLTWFSLAAYNVGMGHLEDARVITQRLGGNADLWADVAKHLPLLQNSKYYQNARHGYARGSEPVNYVKNIRHYYSILQWQDIAANKPLPPVETDDYLPRPLRSAKFFAL